MADGLCSESDRKQFVAALINENGISAGEKSRKCVNSKYQSRRQSATIELERVETVKRCVNREQLNMTATGQQQLQQPQQQQQQSKKVLDAKYPSKNKSASMSSAIGIGMSAGGTGTPTSKSATGSAKLAGVGKGLAAVGAGVGCTGGSGGGGSVANTVLGKLNNASRGASEIDEIGPPKMKNASLPGSISAGVANGSQVQQKDLNSASAANVDMAEEKCGAEPGQQTDPDDNPSAKKKRCSDRYDSSESSDSGVATLSCTDSSTASSDASDPGSPYSPASLGEDANQSSTKANMPPQILSIAQQSHRILHPHQSHHQTTAAALQQAQKQQHQTTTTVQHQWPWNVSSNNNTISNINNSNNCSGSSSNNNLIVNANKNSSSSIVNSALSGNNNASAKNKRILSTNHSDINGTAKKVRTSAGSSERMHTQAGLTAAASKRLRAQQEESQTKITGYFKSQMKPLKAPLKGDLSTFVARATNTDAQLGVNAATGALDKYFNGLAAKATPPAGLTGTKEDKEQNSQRKSVAIKKDFLDVPPLAHTMPSLKKLERKPAKVAQVAPISRKTAVTPQLKSPKKHIAIAPRTMEVNQAQKAPPTNAFQIDQTKISQPTVLLTAIRIPPQTGTSQQQIGSAGNVGQQSSTKAPPLTPTKMGSMLQIPVVPNLVQIPNLLTTTNGTNLVMNNGQLTRVGNGGQYFLNGTVLKLQQISNGHAGGASGANGVLAMDSSALQGNILVKPPTAISQTLPIVTSSAQPKTSALALQQPLVAQASMNGNGCHQAFLTTTGQRLPAQSVFMATTSGWYVLNQSTSDPISNNIPQQTTLTTAMVCKSTRTAVTSLTNAVSPPVPPLVTLASKHETISSGPKAVTFSTPATATTSIPAELKDKTAGSNTIIEPEKPLTVECPPLEALPEIQIPAIVTDHKLESPKIASLPSKSSSLPVVNSTNDIEDEEDSLAPASTSKCAISPILSQPKTIRFPVPSGCEAGYRFGPKGTKRSDGVCYWDQCSEKYDNCSKLLDHLQTEHVNTQTGPFSCLWSGCKVRGRESCSRRWLERHVLSHGGTKPFKCIVDGCGLRLGSQLALQKHVNGHFNATESKDNSNKRTSDPPIPKLLRKNGKKARYRRQPFSARMFDFFDTGIMEGLQHRLLVTGSYANGSKGSVTFHGHSMARRKTPAGITELYVKWSPREIIPDEWVPETKDALIKTITIQSMRYQERFALQKFLETTNYQSDISVKSVSNSQLFPSTLTALSSLFADSCSSSDVGNATEISCEKKQSRKPPKRNKIEPS